MGSIDYRVAYRETEIKTTGGSAYIILASTAATSRDYTYANKGNRLCTIF